MKRILTIQDISCIGRCSLTAALPVLCACGHEAVPLPTAVLSTQTQFQGVHFRDLTEDVLPICRHWKREGFSFDALLLGYLGSVAQIGLVEEVMEMFGMGASGGKAVGVASGGASCPVILDPVMADGGKLYTGFTAEFVDRMKDLCKRADVILPNLSEAALLTGMSYPGEDATLEQVAKLLRATSMLGARYCVITGVTLADDKLGYMGIDHANGEIFSYGVEKVPFTAHGTGDLFAATFVGTLLRKGAGSSGTAEDDKATSADKLQQALRIATEFTAKSIAATRMDPNRREYGVNFEQELPWLISLLP